jgi:hypothetical protein
MVNFVIRAKESPIGHKPSACDPSLRSDFMLEELQGSLDRIYGMEFLAQDAHRQSPQGDFERTERALGRTNRIDRMCFRHN